MLYIYSKCRLNRKFVDKKKNHDIKEMADNVFSTCLCITIFKVMSASDKDHLRTFLFVMRTGGFPTKDATITADGVAQFLFSRYIV